MRSSFSCARRRRLRCLPRPAASSMSRRRSRGLDVTIVSTRPCETTECISLPRPVSERISRTSTSRQRAPLRRYSPSPERSRRRTIEISPIGTSTAPSALSMTSSTSADERACTPRPPPKMTSRIDWPRTASGDCSPIAHSTASVTLDLPEPLGPTTTDTPGPNSSFVRSGKDLKPLSVSERRCTRSRLLLPLEGRGASGCSASSAIRAASCSACFFERPAPRPTGAPPTVATTSKVRSCGGPSSAAIVYSTVSARRARRSCSVDLKSTGLLSALLDLGLEGLDDRLRRPLVAAVQVAGPDDRLDDRRQDALGLDERLGALTDPARRRRAQPVGHAEALGDRPAGDARDALRADLRQPPGAEALGLQARVEVRGHREPEHRVAEERQPRVGVAAALRPRRVREHLPVEMFRQLFEEGGEELQGSARQSGVAACARTKSTA